jgi:hypothetical protein
MEIINENCGVHVEPLLCNDRETNEAIAVAKQRPARQWTGFKTGFSARSTPMAAQAAKDTETGERCFLHGPCRGAISGTKFRA